MKTVYLIICLVICSCSSSKVYTKKELKNIKKTDSIAKAEINSRILDFKEETQEYE